MTQFDFYPAIPATNNSPSVDQPNMQTNNQSTNDILAIDHVTFNVANGGTHKQVTFISPLVSDPSLTGTQGEVYTKSVSGIAQLFFANSSVVNQLTAAIASNASFTCVTLPSGLKVCFSGILSFSTEGTPYSFPVIYTTAPSVIANCEGGSSNFRALSTTSTTTGMIGYSQTSSTNVFVIAIGI